MLPTFNSLNLESLKFLIADSTFETVMAGAVEPTARKADVQILEMVLAGICSNSPNWTTSSILNLLYGRLFVDSYKMRRLLVQSRNA